MSIRFGLAAAFTAAVLMAACLSPSNAQVITHRDVGVRMGLAIAVAGLLGTSLHFVMLGVLLTALVPAIYSYLMYLRLERERGSG